jgi:CheY-like chemotaxis protein
MEVSPVKILLIDDDIIDRTAIHRAFHQANLNYAIIEAVDGEAALAMLQGKGDICIEKPFLILLDLKMPKMDGIEFLTELRKDENFNDTIVFVLSTSNSEKDKKSAYEKNIAGYLVKNIVDTRLLNTIMMLHHFICEVEFPQ